MSRKRTCKHVVDVAIEANRGAAQPQSKRIGKSNPSSSILICLRGAYAPQLELLMSGNLRELFTTFFSRYDEEEKNAIWKSQSQRFRDFWNDRIMTDRPGELDDIEIDEIVRILDRVGKGNTAASEAIA